MQAMLDVAPKGDSRFRFKEVRAISETEFGLYQRLIYRESGIFLSTAKKELLVARLTRRLRDLGLRSFSAYHRIVKNDCEERVRMLDCICTNETRFFREPRQFDLLERRIFPAWRAAAPEHLPRRLRVWSAACSTGEEPYSLAMVLLDNFPGWQIEILATDLSTRALERARTAVWPLEKAMDFPQTYLERFMMKGYRSQKGKITAGSEIRSVVRFHRLNLNDEKIQLYTKFDLIFCRNVLIYFDAKSRKKAISRILGQLSPSGYLFLGNAESLHGLADQVRGVMPSVYTPAGNGGAPRMSTPGGALPASRLPVDRWCA